MDTTRNFSYQLVCFS